MSFYKKRNYKEGLLGQNPGRYSELVLKTWDSIRLERALSMFLQLYRDIRYSLDVRYELDLAITKLCWLSSYVSGNEVKAAIEEAKAFFGGNGPVSAQIQVRPSFVGNANITNNSTVSRRTEGPFVNGGSFTSLSQKEEEKTVAEPIIANSALSLEEVKNLEIQREIDNKNTIVGIALQDSEDWRMEGNAIKITVKNPLSLQKLNSNVVSIAKNIAEIWGKKVFVQFELKKEVSAEEIFNSYPKEIQDLCNVFAGKVESVMDSMNEDNRAEDKKLSNSVENQKSTEKDNEAETPEEEYFTTEESEFTED